METSTFHREKATYGILPMQINRTLEIGLSFIDLGPFLGPKNWPQSTTQRYDRSTTCNCILEARSALLNLTPCPSHNGTLPVFGLRWLTA